MIHEDVEAALERTRCGGVAYMADVDIIAEHLDIWPELQRSDRDDPRERIRHGGLDYKALSAAVAAAQPRL